MIQSAVDDTAELPATLAQPATSAFRYDLLAALTHEPRRISPKYFYDATGSALFDRICDLPEYYPTCTEVALLERHASEIAQMSGANAEIVEFGAGSLLKIRLLLDALEKPRRFVPIDISADHLEAAAAGLARDYPELAVLPVAADYTRELELPAALPGSGRRIGFFPGSTIGNFTADESLAFLRTAGRVLRGGALLLGADLVKDPALLHAAYNDTQGVTAAFNLNLLARANRELGADFKLERFAHSAFYNAPVQRVEMHLMSLVAQVVHVAGRTFEFAQGQTLHTENSQKFTVEGLRKLAAHAGFKPGPVWVDEAQRFSLHWLWAPAS